MQQVVLQLFSAAAAALGDGDDDLPNDPRRRHWEGPWLQQQLVLSSVIGVASFLLFSLLRRRYSTLFAPRTKLAGFSPHADGLDDGVFAWLWPTLRAPEAQILHIVGLDAAILLNFFKMSFWIFTVLSVWSCAVLMPVNWHYNGSIDGVAPSEELGNHHQPHTNLTSSLPVPPPPHVPWTPPSVSAYHLTHFASLYFASFLVLRALSQGGKKFVRSRQLYALDLLPSIPARTIEMRALPPHLRDEKALAEYWEACGLPVESTALAREVGGLSGLLQRRAEKLYALERAWCAWLGNPTQAEGYDPDAVTDALHQRALELAQEAQDASREPDAQLRDGLTAEDLERAPLLGAVAQPAAAGEAPPIAGIKHPQGKARPTKRVGRYNPFSKKVDLLDSLARDFYKLDAAVRRAREKERPAAATGFVTFVDAASAQIAAQTVHYPLPGYCKTMLAPEPRDIIWSNVSLPPMERRLRQLLVSAFTFALFAFYIPPLTFLASFLSPGYIRKYMPWLWKILKRDERLKALVSTSLPSVVLIAFNALLPLVLEWTAYLQGLRAKSHVEMSVLKRYHLFLMISVIFIFLITRTLWGVLTDLANNPARILDKLAESLPGARFFSLSYVVLQSLAVMPLQLLQLPTIFMRAYGRLFARTPREHAELNAPPQMYAGSVYPSALIVFTLAIVYSLVSPLITVFGALYFGIGYLVFKYKLLFVFYKAYESKGQAWPLSSQRCIWALCLFQVFQIGLFSVRKQLLLSLLCLPLLAGTVWFGRHLANELEPLSEYINLSSITEVLRRGQVPADAAPDAMRHPLLVVHSNETPAAEQTALARQRYAAKDETLFVAQRDTHTDYREPPAAGYYVGTLDTGRRRYGHPAITGKLPQPWLPIPAEEAEASRSGEGDVEANAAPAAEAASSAGDGSALRVGSALKSSTSGAGSDVLVLSLRKRKSSLFKRPRVSSLARSASLRATSAAPGNTSISVTAPIEDDAAGVWGTVDAGPQGSSPHAALGEVLGGPETVAPARRSAREESLAEASDEEDSPNDEERGVYYHRRPFPGSFPGSGIHEEDED